MEDIKAKIVIETGESVKNIQDAQNSLQGLNTQGGQSVGMFSNLKSKLLEASPAAKSASGALGGVNNAFNLLRANPIVFVITTLIGLLIGIVNYMKGVDGASDALSRTWSSLSTIFKAFMDKVLSPLIDAFVWLIDGLGKLASTITGFFSPALEQAANRSAKLRDELNDLEDAEKNNAIAIEETKLKLAEARDMAADSTLTTKQRVAALKEAARIEKEQADEVYRTNLAIYKNKLEQMAMEMNVRQDLIKVIQNGTVEQLKAARAEMLAMKNVNGDKLLELDNYLKQAINNQSASQKIQTKTEKQITALEKEEQSKREQQQKEAAAKQKELRDKQIAEEKKYIDLKNKILKDQAEDETKSELQKIKLKIQQDEAAKLKEINALKVSEEKKGQLRNMVNLSALENLAKAEKDFFAKLAAEQEAEDKAKAEAAKKKKEDEANKRFESQIKQLEAEQKARADKEKQLEELQIRVETPEQKLQRELLALENKYKAELAIIGQNEELKAKLIEEKERATAELRSQYQNQQLNETKSVGDAIIGIVGQQTAVGKGLGIANALINTYQGATDALRAKSTLPSPFDVIAKIANVAAVLSSGFKAVKAITSVQVPGASSGGGANISAAAPISPQQASTQLNAATIQAVGNAASGTGKNFVLAKDIKDNQEREATLQRAARLG